jgi:long-subunit fatty acid transport protein
MRLSFFALPVAFFCFPVFAGSIQAPGVIAGPDSGVTTPNPAAAFYNPAALARAKGLQAILDVQLAMVRVDVTSWRNGGFDPNTGEPYDPAQARVKVPVSLLGLSYEILEDRLTAGFTLSMPFLGGGDYTTSENAGAPPYTSHQRYFGVNTKVITAQFTPAVGFTPMPEWGLHVGAGFNYTMDIIDVTKTSNTGKEGLGGTDDDPKPYSADAILDGKAKGSHLGYTVGLFFDKYEMAQVGVSYQSGGTFHAEGDAEVTFPGFLVTGGDSKKVPGEFTVDIKLPPVLRTAFNSQITDAWNVGVGWDHFMWYQCCGTKRMFR